MILGDVDLGKTVKSFGTTDGAEYAALAIIEGVPRRQLVGFEPSDISGLNCRFHQALLPFWPTVEAIVALKESGEIVELQSANGDTWGHFVVERIAMSNFRMLPDQTVIAADVVITLGDPGTPADVDVPAPVAVTGVSGAQSGPPLEDRSTAPGDATASQIARRG